MQNVLIRQATFVPLAAMLVPILIAFFVPGYSSLAQHISEVALLDHPIVNFGWYSFAAWSVHGLVRGTK